MALGVSFPTGVNFTNILFAAFTPEDPKNEKMIVKSSLHLALLFYALVKASGKMLVKLTPDLLIFQGKKVSAKLLLITKCGIRGPKSFSKENSCLILP